MSARQGPRVLAACSTGGFSPTAVSIGGMLNHRLIWRFPDIPPFQLAVAISTGGSRLFLQIMYPKIYLCKIVKKERGGGEERGGVREEGRGGPGEALLDLRFG